jgi:hypothetical protein
MKNSRFKFFGLFSNNSSDNFRLSTDFIYLGKSAKDQKKEGKSSGFIKSETFHDCCTWNFSIRNSDGVWGKFPEY